MNILIFTKSVNIVGGVEKVVDIHCKWLLSSKANIKILTLKKTSYESYKKINYKNIAKCDIEYCNSIFSNDFGFNLIRQLILDMQNYSKVIVHQPFLNGLLSITISTAIKKIKREALPEIYFYHHAIPSKNLVSRLVYIFLSKLLFLTNKKTKLIASTNSIENKKFAIFLGTNLEIVAIPIPEIKEEYFEKEHLKNDSNKELIDKLFSKKNKEYYFFTYIGRIAKYKGLINLIKTLPLIKKNIFLLIAGNGPISHKIKKIINRFPEKLQKRVIFIDRYINETEKYKILEISDVFIFPSITKSEAYGIMQLEALYMGLPLINTNLGTGVNIVAQECDHIITCKERNSYLSLANSINDMEYRLTSSKYKFSREKIKAQVMNLYSNRVIKKEFNKTFGINK